MDFPSSQAPGPLHRRIPIRKSPLAPPHRSPRRRCIYLNAYAPNSPNARRELWDELASSLPQDCKWILGGDWNVVEDHRDKSNSEGYILTGAEKVSFQQLMAGLEVFDTFDRTSPIRYTWDNRRSGTQRVLARLDRYYTFAAPAGEPHAKEYAILGDSNHSDHLPVRCSIELKAQTKRPSPWKMNSFYLDDPEVKDTITKIWSTHTTLGFFGKIRRCTRFYRSYCKQKARANRESEERLRSDLVTAMENLQTKPRCAASQHRLSECADALEKLELHRVKGQQIRSRTKWMQVGDTGSKEFYRATKKRSGASYITELEDDHGIPRHDQNDLEEICISYYRSLYTAGPQSTEVAAARTEVLSCLVDSLSTATKRPLTCPYPWVNWMLKLRLWLPIRPQAKMA